jgi:hypothetical protein
VREEVSCLLVYCWLYSVVFLEINFFNCDYWMSSKSSEFGWFFDSTVSGQGVGSSTDWVTKLTEPLGGVHKLSKVLGGRRGQRFDTKPFNNIGICRVLRYERGGGGQKSRKIALRNLWTSPSKIRHSIFLITF